MNFAPPEDDGLDEKGQYPQSRYDQLVAEIAHKYDAREWLRRCVAKELATALQEEFDAEAGRLEFECNVPRQKAEEQAAKTVFEKHNLL